MKYLQLILLSSILTFVSLHEFAFTSHITLEAERDHEINSLPYISPGTINFDIFYYDNGNYANLCFDQNDDLIAFLNNNEMETFTKKSLLGKKFDDDEDDDEDEDEDEYAKRNSRVDKPMAIKEPPKTQVGDNRICLHINLQLCDDKMINCSYFEKNFIRVKITFDEKFERPPGLTAKILRDRQNTINGWMSNKSRLLMEHLGPNNFNDMNLYQIKVLYYVFVAKLEGQFKGIEDYENAKTTITDHFKQNMYYYKDNMGEILTYLNTCSDSDEEKEEFISIIESLNEIEISDPPEDEVVISEIKALWKQYAGELYEYTKLHKYFYKSIFTSLLSTLENLKDFELNFFYQDENFMPNNFQSKKGLMKKFLVNPICSAKAIKSYMESTLVNAFKGLNKLEIKKNNKFRKIRKHFK
jgi:hypothetical protein